MWRPPLAAPVGELAGLGDGNAPLPRDAVDVVVRMDRDDPCCRSDAMAVATSTVGPTQVQSCGARQLWPPGVRCACTLAAATRGGDSIGEQ